MPLNQVQLAESPKMDVVLEKKRTISLVSKLKQPIITASKTSESNSTSKKSLKRPHENAVSSEETISISTKKKQSIEFIDTDELARKVHIALSRRSISYETFASSQNMKRNALIELLDHPKPWHLLNETKQKQYLNLNSWVTSLRKAKTFEIEVLRLAKDKDGTYRTSIIAEQTRFLLFKFTVGHEYFAENYLSISKIKFQKLVKEPVPWAQCSDEERKLYRSCYDWAVGGETAGRRLRSEHIKAISKVSRSYWAFY
jgi:hypothetical protein